jgi:hypothetical protein
MMREIEEPDGHEIGWRNRAIFAFLGGLTIRKAR